MRPVVQRSADLPDHGPLQRLQGYDFRIPAERRVHCRQTAEVLVVLMEFPVLAIPDVLQAPGHQLVAFFEALLQRFQGGQLFGHGLYSLGVAREPACAAERCDNYLFFHVPVFLL